MALDPMWFAWKVVASGLSANEGIRLLREAGLHVRRQNFLRLVGTIRNNYGQRIAELDQPLGRRPRPHEITPIDTRTHTGYIHYVDIITRNLDTGANRVRPMAVHSRTLLTREEAIRRAVRDYRTAVDRSKVTPSQWDTDPRETVELGVYQATHRFEPRTE